MVTKEAGDRIKFKLSLADQVGAAFHQNAIPVLNTLMVENRLGRDLLGLKLEIRSEPPFTCRRVGGLMSWPMERVSQWLTRTFNWMRAT